MCLSQSQSLIVVRAQPHCNMGMIYISREWGNHNSRTVGTRFGCCYDKGVSQHTLRFLHVVRRQSRVPNPPFDGQQDYYPFLKTRYSKYIPQTGTTTFLPPPDSPEINMERGKNVAEAGVPWDDKEWRTGVSSGGQSNAGSSKHPFQEDSTVDLEDSDESAPPQDEFSAADLQRADSVSEARYEQGAMKLLQDTLFQIGAPDSQISVPDTKPKRHLQTFQLVSMLLQYRDAGDEVTATTMINDLHTQGSEFLVLYAKNKKVLTADDERRAKDLVNIVKVNAVKSENEFIESMFAYMVEHSSLKFNRICRYLDTLISPLLGELARFLNGTERTTWQHKTIKTLDYGDLFIQALCARNRALNRSRPLYVYWYIWSRTPANTKAPSPTVLYGE